MDWTHEELALFKDMMIAGCCPPMSKRAEELLESTKKESPEKFYEKITNTFNSYQGIELLTGNIAYEDVPLYCCSYSPWVSWILKIGR